MTQEIRDIAVELGKQAFRNRLENKPTQDTNLNELIKPIRRVSEWMKVCNAWVYGWMVESASGAEA